MFLGSQVRRLDIDLDPTAWQLDDSQICSVGMIEPAEGRAPGLESLSPLSGVSTLTGCGDPEQLDQLPGLPAAEERRLRRAASLLQQRLVLRQWLVTHRLHHAYARLLSLDVSSLEDVYWLEDSVAQHALEPEDFGPWSAARHGLPTGKEQLQTLKADLWNAVVKNSRHQDAWTWGGMLVVSVSVAGLVTLAAMTQPSLAPEAKHSLLQYVTGKYLHPPSCKVEWGWQEPVTVGDTMCLSVLCYQRNGQPYPVCDTDHLSVAITHSNMKVSVVTELGSGEPSQAHMARVHFTVRAAGLYLVSVAIGGQAIAGSPFRRYFAAGAVCARASRVAAGPAVVCRVHRACSVLVHARDQYDNPAPSPDLQEFSVSLCPLGGESPAEGALVGEARFSHDAVNKRVVLELTYPRAGVTEAVVYYRGEELPGGRFHCIVLTESDAASVQRTITTKQHSACYAATLLQPEAGGRPRRVLCCLSPRQLVLKEYVLKVIPRRIQAFRLCPSTKLVLQPSAECSPGGTFTLDDGVQPRLQLASRHRDLLAAAFTQLRAASLGGEDCFKNKQEYFYRAVRAAHARRPRDRLTLRVRRADLLGSSLRATRHFTTNDWCKNFDVSFEGEQGVDWGGVRREWFSLLCAELFDARLGLFAALHESRAALVHPNPARPPHLKLKHFELAGKLVGKCLYESALGGTYRQPVQARFTRSFLAQLAGLRVHYKHFEQDDPELYLSKIKYVLETDLEAGGPEIYFSDDVYEGGRLVTTHELLPGGASLRVTNANKHLYLDALAQWRLAARVKREVDAVLRGLMVLVPDNLLSIFDEPELELLACGSGSVCAAAWRAHSVALGTGGGWERRLRWFWAAVGSLSPGERARLLQFTTGCSHLPPNGFQDLSPRFQITAAPTHGALPTAHTCFNQLCLPDYDSYEHLVRALLWAINEGAEGFPLV